MLYRVNGGDQYHYSMGDDIRPLEVPQDLILVIDPSKTNMGVVVGTTTGDILMLLEFSGKDINQKAIDTTDYCLDFDSFLKGLLKRCNIFLIAQEKTILPNSYGKGSNHKKGYDHYYSNQVLNEIRSNIIRMSIDLTGKKPEEINNMAWKGAILPDGYRGRNEKGSKRFMATFAPQFAHYSDDITDAICMYLYLVKKYENKIVISCNKIETTRHEYAISFVEQKLIPKDTKYFKYNPNFSCEENAIYFVNRCSTLGACKLPIESIGVEDIYKYSHGLLSNSEPFMIVRRKDPS